MAPTNGGEDGEPGLADAGILLAVKASQRQFENEHGDSNPRQHAATQHAHVARDLDKRGIGHHGYP
jgi:hypothetical protein